MMHIILLIAAAIISIHTPAYAVTVSGEVEVPQSTPAPTAAPVSIVKKTVFVVKVESNILYSTDNAKYDISTANVVDASNGRLPQKGEKRAAELTYVNGVLKEVYIHK
ncbi:MAG: hypothetical protein HQL01_14205 [Nitrospirae bacterium]|nr:hypothetical protein [Nitrospirota bacterium]